jgi:hypothetical protein
MPATTNEQVALLTSFEPAHGEQVTRQFMAAEQEAPAFMLLVRANAARKVAQAKEITEEAASEAAARKEMTRDRARWDKDMATARRAREIHELANERRHRQCLARHQANHARQTDGEGSNTVDTG